MPRDLYILTTCGDDRAGSDDVRDEVARGEWERFAARFVNGLVQQCYHQIGPRPVGEVTANRVANDLILLLRQVGACPADRPWDATLFQNLLNLDMYAPKPRP